MTAVHDKAPASVGAPTGASEPQQPSTETTNAPVIFIAGQPGGKAVVIFGDRIEGGLGADLALLLDKTTLSEDSALCLLALSARHPEFVAWMPVRRSAG